MNFKHIACVSFCQHFIGHFSNAKALSIIRAFQWHVPWKLTLFSQNIEIKLVYTRKWRLHLASSPKYHRKGTKDWQNDRSFWELSSRVLKLLHTLWWTGYTKYTFLLSSLNYKFCWDVKLWKFKNPYVRVLTEHFSGYFGKPSILVKNGALRWSILEEIKSVMHKSLKQAIKRTGIRAPHVRLTARARSTGRVNFSMGGCLGMSIINMIRIAWTSLRCKGSKKCRMASETYAVCSV